MKLAVVGGGASAFYVASRLLSRLPKEKGAIHVFDRLWAPHGLVRYGVAPDHPEVKNCSHKFDEVATDPRFRFFGNVNIRGEHPQKAFAHNVQLPLSSLYKNYSHILFASGCPLSSLHPALPPSDRCIPALRLVHWYTQYPSNPPPPPLETAKHVTLIGNGNVSLDVARMLLTPPNVLRQYDIPSSVLGVLERSAVQHVSIVARRGPFDAAFTTKELRELTKLPNASMVPIPSEILEPSSGAEVSRQQKRTIQLLKAGSEQPFGTTARTWSLDFYRSPVGFADGKLLLAHTTTVSPSTQAVPTGETSTVDTDLVITSIGFKGDPELPFYDPSLGHLRTMAGRLVTPSTNGVIRNVYASGWAAMGAKGVLASTMMDANGVADTILSDLSESLDPLKSLASDDQVNPVDPPSEVIGAGADVLSYEDWKRIDEAETQRGRKLGKERERLDWSEVKALLTSN